MIAEYMTMVAAAAAVISVVICQARQFHMLQLNSYFASRYLDWLKTAFSYRTVFAALAYALSLLLLLSKAGNLIPLAAFAVLSGALRCLFAVYGVRRAKKKLVVTPRVQRMFVTSLALALVPLILVMAGVSPFWPLFSLLTLLLLAPVLTLLALFINKPLELLIARWYVNDARKILRSCHDMTVIGITGSYGKTSTKFILGRILSEQYQVTVTPESYNTLLGVVRTIRERLKPGTQVFIAEMGAKNIGDIREICELVHPSLGIITAVGPQHLSTFKTVENVARTKFELADEVQKNGGTMYLNGDSAPILPRAASCRSVLYGVHNENAPCRAEGLSAGRHGLRFEVVYGQRRIPLETKLLGSHNVLNILAAVCVACDLGLSDNQIKYAVSRLAPTPHRLEMKPFFAGSVLIDDAYNANPEGALEAVRVLGSFDGCRKIIVTPGLVELGDAEFEHNRRLGEEIAKYCDTAVLVGKKRAIPIAEGIRDAGFPQEQLLIVEDFGEALAYLQKTVTKDCAVLFENDLPDNYSK